MSAAQCGTVCRVALGLHHAVHVRGADIAVGTGIDVLRDAAHRIVHPQCADGNPQDFELV